MRGRVNALTKWRTVRWWLRERGDSVCRCDKRERWGVGDGEILAIARLGI